MIATFYSFKGGVGRSMAVANVADLLARQGLSVLVIDFDLEAPGLEQFFQIDHLAARWRAGLLDLLLSFKEWMSVTALPGEEPAFRRLDDFILPIYTQLPSGGRLDLLHAGRREPKEAMDAYVASLRSFDWQDFYSNWDGELFFEYLRTHLGPPHYDLVIVDSRTGVTEMGGICTFQLADVIVLFTGANQQNRRGTVEVVRDYESLPPVVRHDRRLQILIVPARVEQRDPALLQAFVESFESQFGDRLPAKLREAGLTYKDILIPYEPAYAFEERVLSDPNRADQRRAIAAAFERLAQAVKLLAAKADDVPPPPAAPAETAYDAARRFASFDVFVSCSASDADAVKQLVDLLETRLQAAVFVDRRELVSGDDWRARTAHALFHSRVCLVCYGPSGLQPSHLTDLTTAAEGAVGAHGLAIVPVLLPGANRSAFQASMPTVFARTVPLDLRAGLGSPGVEVALRNVCGPETPFDVETATSLRAEPVDRFVAAGSTAKCPYPGPRPFTEGDGQFYFGRTKAITVIADALELQGAIVVTGASGSGKTSIVHGGVIPLLRKRAGENGATLTVRQLDGGCTRKDIDRAIADLEEAGGANVCVVDHLERFLRGSSTVHATAVLARLAEASRTGRIRVITLCRDARLNEVRPLSPLGFLDGDHVIALQPLNQDQLRQIIEKPAECAGLAFEPGLVERLLSDFGLDQRFLLFLQIVLRDLWKSRREGFLTNRGYDESPDPVEEWAERAYGSFSAELKSCAELIIPRLSTLCDNLTPIGRSVGREQLLVSAVGELQLNALIASLVDNGLVYSTTDDAGRTRLAPAFTIEEWPRAEAWQTEQWVFQTWLAPFATQLADYQRSLGSHTLLMRSEVLELAETQPADWLTVDEAAFIKASRDRANRLRRERAIAITLAVAVILLIAFGIIAAWRERARENESDARVLLQLSRNLAKEGKYREAAQGLDRAEALFASAGLESEVLNVGLERARSAWQQGKHPEALRLFNDVVTAAAPTAGQTRMAALREPLVEASRYFYTQGQVAAVDGFQVAWRMSGRRSTNAQDLAGHRFSLALATAHRYDEAQRAFREAVGATNPDPNGLAQTFYEQTLRDAPKTTQAYDNLAQLLRVKKQTIDAVRLLDNGIARSIQDDPAAVVMLGRTRRNLLARLDASDLRGDSEMGRYVCSHNTYVTVRSVAPASVDRALADLRSRYPLAAEGHPVRGMVPIIADFFLTCDEASGVIRRELANGHAPVAGGWYRGCQTCSGPP